MPRPATRDEARIICVDRYGPDSQETYAVYARPGDDDWLIVERMTEWIDGDCDPYVVVPRAELEAAVFEAVDRIARKYARPGQFFGW